MGAGVGGGFARFREREEHVLEARYKPITVRLSVLERFSRARVRIPAHGGLANEVGRSWSHVVNGA